MHDRGLSRWEEGSRRDWGCQIWSQPRGTWWQHGWAERRGNRASRRWWM